MRRCSAGPREIRATSNAPSAAPMVARQLKGEGRPLIADFEYDHLYKALEKLEIENPLLVTPDSPTQRVGYTPSGGQLTEVRHSVPMLSLNNAFSHDEVRAFYGAADLMVFPRVQHRLTDMVTPLKPLEAMAMGKPLVASDIGGHRELIKDRRTGLLFSPGSVSSLVSAVETLLDDEALRADLVREGRAWVESNRTWDVTTAVYRNVYARARSLSARKGADSWKRHRSDETAQAR